MLQICMDFHEYLDPKKHVKIFCKVRRAKLLATAEKHQQGVCYSREAMPSSRKPTAAEITAPQCSQNVFKLFFKGTVSRAGLGF
jgi:hypothetical protein